MVSSELEVKVSQLTTELLRLKSEYTSFDNGRRSELEALGSRVEELVSLANLNSKKTISDIEGRRFPRWYSVDIPFLSGDTAPRTSTVEVTGRPFICTQMQSLYLLTDGDPANYASVDAAGTDTEITAEGRSYPTTAYFATIANLLYNWNVKLGHEPPTPSGNTDYFKDVIGYLFSEDTAIPAKYVGWGYPDFDFEIRNANSGRRWTDAKVPSASFYGATGNPLFLSHSAFVDQYDRIEVTAHPTPRPTDVSSINTGGLVRFVLFGYEIETPEYLSDIFGY